MRTILALVICTAGTLGCGSVCNTAWYPSGLTIEVASDGPFPPGRYQLVVNEEQRLSFAVDGNLILDDTRNVWVSINNSPSGSIHLLVPDFTPGQVTIVLSRDGAEAARLVEANIRYQKDEPNGDGCGVRSLGLVTMQVKSSTL